MKDIRTVRQESKGAKRAVATQEWVRRVRARTTLGTVTKYRPEPKIERRKSHSWLLCLDAMIRSSTAFEGLQAFQYELGTRPKDAHDWKLLICNADMGSDGVCGSNYVRHSLSCNIDMRWGPAHRAWNDTKAALRYAQLWAHEVLMIIVYNAEFGSWHDDERCWQVRDVVQSNFDSLDETTDVGFQHVVGGLVEDSGSALDMGSPDIVGKMYKYLVDAPIWKRKFDHVSTNRFFGAIKRGQEEAPWWTARFYGYLSLMIETDTLPAASKSIGLKLVRPDPSTRSTAKQKETARVLKASAKNVTELAYLMYADRENRSLQVVISTLSDVAVKWYMEHNTSTRSGNGTFKWIHDQCDGGFFKHLCDFARGLSNERLQLDCGVHVSQSQTFIDEDVHLDSPCVKSNDRLASYAGNLVLGFLSSRLRHGLPYLVGWPTRSSLLASDDESVRKAAVEEFKRSYSTWMLMKEKSGTHPLIATMVERSEWSSLPVVQLREMLRSQAWKLDDRTIDFCKQRNSTLWTDQVAEDGFNHAKASARNVPNKRLSHQSVWLAPVKKRVLEEIHQWERPTMDFAGSFRGAKTSDEQFVPSADSTWDALGGIKSTTSATWHSPGPDRLWEHLTDQSLMREAMRTSRTDKFGNLWMQVFFSGGEMLVRDRTKKVCRGEWVYPLVPSGASTFLAWPAQDITPPEFPHRFFVPHTDPRFNRDLVEVSIWTFDLDDWDALAYDWISPLHQACLLKGRMVDFTHRFAVSKACRGEESLRMCAARNAYWSIPLSPTLAKFSEYVKCDLDDCSNEFESIFNLVKAELGCDDAEALEICRLREFHSQKERSVDTILTSEDVLELLSKDDQKDVLKQKKKWSASKENIKSFARSLKERSRHIKSAAKKVKGKGKKGKRPNPWGDRKYKKVKEGELTQTDFRDLMPPGCHIWCNRSHSSWCCHYPAGRAYHSRSWSYGYRESALTAIAETWRSFLDKHDLEDSDCPIENLF